MNDIHPLKPMIQIGLFDTQFLFLSIVLILFLFILFVLYIYKKRTKINIDIEQIIPEVSPEQIVDTYYISLNDIEHLLHKFEYQEYFLNATEIIKACISDVYNIKIQELTTKEVTNITTLPSHIMNALLLFLRHVDKEKFDDVNVDNVRADFIVKDTHRVFDAIKENILAEKNKILKNAHDK